MAARFSPSAGIWPSACTAASRFSGSGDSFRAAIWRELALQPSNRAQLATARIQRCFKTVSKPDHSSAAGSGQRAAKPLHQPREPVLGRRIATPGRQCSAVGEAGEAEALWGNPILSPNPAQPWEALVTTNPGACYDEARGQVVMLYRAAGQDPEHRISFGLATSADGYHFTRASDEPVFGPSHDGFDAGCVEDARVIKLASGSS